MDDHSYLLFNQSPEDMRRIGARGGRAAGRTRRARRDANLTWMQAIPEVPLHDETAAEAIATLNAQFPWLNAAQMSRYPDSTTAGFCVVWGDTLVWGDTTTSTDALSVVGEN